MKERWLPIGVLAAALFAINVVARLVVRFAFDADDSATDMVTLFMLVAGVQIYSQSFTAENDMSAEMVKAP